MRRGGDSANWEPLTRVRGAVRPRVCEARLSRGWTVGTSRPRRHGDERGSGRPWRMPKTFHGLGAPEPEVVVAVRWRIVVAVGGAHVGSIVVVPTAASVDASTLPGRIEPLEPTLGSIRRTLARLCGACPASEHFSDFEALRGEVIALVFGQQPEAVSDAHEHACAREAA